MRIVGSVIARAGSKRLPFKNLLPYQGVPLVRRAVLKLAESELFSDVVLSTESELIARTCLDIEGVSILRRPEDLASDDTASIPVFQHITQNFPCHVHLNYNCNFPECPNEIFNQAISIALESGESLSDPYAVWAQTSECLKNYGNPFKISAKIFPAKNVHPVDVHTLEDLILVHKQNQPVFDW